VGDVDLQWKEWTGTQEMEWKEGKGNEEGSERRGSWVDFTWGAFAGAAGELVANLVEDDWV